MEIGMLLSRVRVEEKLLLEAFADARRAGRHDRRPRAGL